MTRIAEYSRGPYTFDVIDSGPEDGTPVVLLHGFPERAASWAAVTEGLNAKGLRTYAVDQRGYAPRARPTSRFGYRGSELVEDVQELITRIGQPVHLVGHDWGAAVAWGVAGRHPETLASLTAISVPHPGAFLKSMLTSTQGLKSYYMALFQIPGLPHYLLRRPKTARSFLRNAGMTHAEVDTYLKQIVDDGALKGGMGWYRSLPLADRADLKVKISVPTTYIWSDGDIALGRKGADLCANYVTGPYRFEIIEGASHWLPTQHPETIANLIAETVADARDS